jgi:DNA-binding CsgD family transcriptional regulator
VTLYTAALQLVESSPSADQEQRYAVLLRLARAVGRAGDVLRAKEVYVQAVEAARILAPRVGPQRAAEMMAEAAVDPPGAWVESGAVDWGLVRALEDTLDALEERDSPLRARALARLSAELYFADQPERRIALAREALNMAARLGDQAALAYVLESAHLALWTADSIDERLSITAELQRLAELGDDPDLALLARAWRITALLELGDFASASRERAEYARAAERLQRPLHLWTTAMWDTMDALFAGRFEQAMDTSARMHAIMLQIRDPDADMFLSVHTLVAFAEQGRLGELTSVEAALRGFSEQLPNLAMLRCWLAFFYVEQDRLSEAAAELEYLAGRGLECLPRDLTWLANVATLSDVCASVGDLPRAAALYQLLEPYARRPILIGHGLACRGTTSRPLGRLAALLDLGDAARRHFEDALVWHTEVGARPLLARTQCDYAAWLARGDATRRARASALLHSARGIAEELGLEPVLRRIAALPLAVADRGAACLTPRELEVLGRLASGFTTREIASELAVSVPTVERHITHIYTKLGARGRADATAIAIKAGLVDAAPR